jgi:hypothetical protein
VNLGAHPSVSQTEYWEHRYGCGGSSGPGSVGTEREWKWSIIDSHVKDLDDVVDIGCGDLSFWEDRSLNLPRDFHYFGLDISRSVIERNRTRHSGWTFQVGNASEPIPNLQGRIVLCLDVLFHILDDAAYTRILDNLACYSLEWIFASTWSRNPFDFQWRVRNLGHTRYVALAEATHTGFLATVRELVTCLRPRQLGRDLRFLLSSIDTDGLYQKYRRFEDYLTILERRDFALVSKHMSPYGTAEAMYVFHRDVPFTL